MERSRSKDVSPWLRAIARLGYATRGLVYMLMGGLSALAAATGGHVVGMTGSMRETARFAPFGRLMLLLVAGGLLAYAVWRFAQSLFNVDGHGSKPAGLLLRLGFFGTAAVYVLLGLLAGEMALRQGSEDGAGQWLDPLLTHPAGRLFLGVVGFSLVVIGIVQLRIAWAVSFHKWVALEKPSPRTRAVIIAVSRAGLIARGVVFGLMGGFVTMGAITADERDFRGIEGTLEELSRQPGGTMLLALASTGLLLYGVYMIITAYYRVFPRR